MKLRGLLDLSLGNFLCMRGNARMGDLYRISKADQSYQRDLIHKHREEMVAFLDSGEFLFFPEIVLGTYLEPDDGDLYKTEVLMASLVQEKSYKETFSNFKLQYSVTTAKSQQESRGIERFRRITLDINEKEIQQDLFQKFARIDGNHRLSATPENPKFKDINIPFCLILFRQQSEFDKLSRALFHNINFKHLPLGMEDSLKLILENEIMFDDDALKNAPSFGWPYYLARQVLCSWDLSLLPVIQSIIEPTKHEVELKRSDVRKRTFLLNSFKLLIQDKLIKETNTSSETFKRILSEINAVYNVNTRLRKSKNVGLLTAFVYYALKHKRRLRRFTHWVIENHIYTIDTIEASEIIKIFDKVIESRKRTIFVSMQFGYDTHANYEDIKNAVEDVNNEHQLGLKIEEIRIDKLNKGHSYKIDDEILELVKHCGLLVADLSLGNKNVYHEIGYLMGLNQGSNQKQDNFILVHNKQMDKSDFDKDVGFNISSYQVLTTNGTEQLRTQLKCQIEKYYGLA